MPTKNIREQTIAFFATKVLSEVSRDPVLAKLLANAGLFVKPTGAYKPGQSIDIDVTKAGSVSIKTDFATNTALSRTKSVFDRFTLSLTALAHTSLYYDMIDNAFTSAGVSGGQSSSLELLIRQKAIDFVDAIEKDLYLRTFNIASLDANKVGASASALTVDDIIKIERNMTIAGWKGGFSIVLDPQRIAEFKIANKGAYTNFVQKENALITRNGFTIDAFPKISFYESTELRTLTEMTNITGTATTQVGFAIADDSTALFNPTLADTVAGEGLGIRNTQVNEGGYNVLITESVDASKEMIENNIDMRALYGSVVYKPAFVLPILGGGVA